MTNEATTVSTPRAPELAGQIVVVIGGSAGIGLETARRARAEGADVVLAARNPERLEQAALELGAQSTAAFDANDPASLERFFEDLPTPIDHVMVTGPGPHYKPPLEMDTDEARAALGGHMVLDTRGRSQRPRQSETRWFAGVHRRHGRSADTSRIRDRLGGHRRHARAHGQPRPRARADPGQSDRARLRRHPVVGFASRRRSRPATRGAAVHAARSDAWSARQTSPRSLSTS